MRSKRYKDYDLLARAVACVFCGAPKGKPCVGALNQPIKHTHFYRRRDANEQRQAALAVRRVELRRKRRVAVPRLALQRVYDMACEMSHSSSYAELDEDCEVIGTDPAILKALEDVRSFFKLKGKP